MTRRLVLTGTAALSVVLLGATGCSGSADDSAGSASPSPTTATPPTLAAGAEAEAVSVLPTGPATGTAVLVYSGVGELNAPFGGDCSHTGDTTEITGSVDTAEVRLEIAPEGAWLALEDVGFSATSDLATGRYDVSGAHLSLDAPLAQDRELIGSVRLEVDCGG